MKKYLLIILSVIASYFISCENLILGPDVENTPQNNFDILWKEFDLYYPSFVVRQVNWDSLNSVYRNQINSNTVESKLWKIFKDMLRNFNDPHIYLYNQDGSKYFNSNYTQDDHFGEFSLDLIRSKYLNNRFKIAGEGKFTYGKLLNDSVGYIYISDFGGNHNWVLDIDLIIAELFDVNCMIVDLRNNFGGIVNNMRYIASAFINEQFAYEYEITRNGPDHNDFTEPQYIYVIPAPNKMHYTKRIILLTNNFTSSASEHIALIFKQLSYTEQIGDYTAGGQGSLTRNFQLPNGWYYSMPSSLSFLPDGQCFEGIGVKPDIRIINEPYRILNGYDDVFEYTLQYISN